MLLYLGIWEDTFIRRSMVPQESAMYLYLRLMRGCPGAGSLL